MVEVSAGLVLGSEQDAKDVLRGLSVTEKELTVTHILSITQYEPDWLTADVQRTEGVITQDGQGAEGVITDRVIQEGTQEAEGVIQDVQGAEAVIQDVLGAEGVIQDVRGAEGVIQDVRGAEGVIQDVRGDEGVIQDLQRTKFMFVEATDEDCTDLLSHFEACCRFIKEGVELGCVLVHCQHGVSRSATVVLAYLMWKEGRSLEILLPHLRTKKPDISPNPGFMEQLELWGGMRCRIDGSNKLYKSYQLLNLSKTISSQESTVDVKSVMSADPHSLALDSTAYYRCRKCRRLLFTEDSVLLHEEGKGQDAFKWHKRSIMQSLHLATPTLDLVPKPAKQRNGNKMAAIGCSSYFIEPMEWMDQLEGNMTGKLLCPKCQARLGAFHWAGQQCSCGKWVMPAFQIHKGKVDETRSLSKRKPHPPLQ